jgi:hypothetical protein
LQEKGHEYILLQKVKDAVFADVRHLPFESGVWCREVMDAIESKHNVEAPAMAVDPGT